MQRGAVSLAFVIIAGSKLCMAQTALLQAISSSAVAKLWRNVGEDIIYIAKH